jgi:uncharacterized protein (DUF2236 family)
MLNHGTFWPESVVLSASRTRSLCIAGVTAVIMEFAEPCVRTGMWEHTGCLSTLSITRFRFWPSSPPLPTAQAPCAT